MKKAQTAKAASVTVTHSTHHFVCFCCSVSTRAACATVFCPLRSILTYSSMVRSKPYSVKEETHHCLILLFRLEKSCMGDRVLSAELYTNIELNGLIATIQRKRRAIPGAHSEARRGVSAPSCFIQLVLTKRIPHSVYRCTRVSMTGCSAAVTAIPKRICKKESLLPTNFVNFV